MTSGRRVVSTVPSYSLVHADCLVWLDRQAPNTVHAIVTDPPYGLKEYTPTEKAKLRNGNKGGVWRIPPSFDGHERSPLPRFTVLSDEERTHLKQFFFTFAQKALRVLVPGAHVLTTFALRADGTLIALGPGVPFEVVRTAGTPNHLSQ